MLLTYHPQVGGRFGQGAVEIENFEKNAKFQKYAASLGFVLLVLPLPGTYCDARECNYYAQRLRTVVVDTVVSLTMDTNYKICQK